MALILQRPRNRQPQSGAVLDPRYGSNVSAWLPSNRGLDSAGRSHLTIASTARFGIAPTGQEISRSGSEFTPAFTVSSLTGATFECWLVVLGNQVASARSVSPIQATTGSPNGFSWFAPATNIIRVTASSSNRVNATPSRPIAAGDAMFFVGKNGDYRAYHAGTRFNSDSSTFGDLRIAQGMLQNIDSFTLLARWTDEIPSDEAIFELLENPWRLFESKRVWVPLGAGGGGTDLTVQEATHGHSADNVVLTSTTGLTVAEALHGHSADSIVIASATGLTVADSTHAHSVDNLTLTIGGITLVVADSTHGHSADSPTLTTLSVLAVQEALHAHLSDEVVAARGYADLVAANALHAHTADNAVLSLPGVATLTIRVLDKAEAGSPLASATGWDFFWYDDATTLAEALAATPTYSALAQSLDASGSITLTLAGSSKTSGQSGYLMFSNGDGTTTQSPPPRSFAALVEVD